MLKRTEDVAPMFAPHRFDPADHDPLVGRRVLVALALPVATAMATFCMLLLGGLASAATWFTLRHAHPGDALRDVFLPDPAARDFLVTALLWWLALTTVALSAAVLAGARRTWTVAGAWIGSVAMAWLAALVAWGPSVLASVIPWGVVVGLVLWAIGRVVPR